MKANVKKIVSFSAIGLILAILLVLNIVCGVMVETLNTWAATYKIVGGGDTSAIRQQGEILADEIEGEGIVMTKNDNVLPLAKTVNKINVFGWSATQWISGGSGSGRVVSGQSSSAVQTGLLEALAAYGEEGEKVEYNTDLINMYKRYQSTRPYRDAGGSDGALHTYNYQYSRLYEPSIESDTAYYTNEILDGAKNFSNTAIVVLGRVSGESNDSPAKQYKGVYNSKGASVDENRHYLEISTEEEALLEYVGANFDKVIVVVNSASIMELGFLKTIPGLDACLLVGATGNNAATAIPKVLYGDVTPSGKTSDTYAYAVETAASFATSGENGVSLYTNGKGLYPADGTTNENVSNKPTYESTSYLDYTESIYVGYKWYETADAEGYWNDVNNEYGKGYDGVVQYPFGYGLSYTDFSWAIRDIKPSRNSTLNAADVITITVDVTNTGDKPGQDVVQLYSTPEYKKGGIEKASVNLVAFGKTTVLKPGESEIVTLTCKAEDLASYDCYDKNGNNFYGYELEAGTVKLNIMKSSHEKSNIPTIEYRSAGIKFDGASNKFTGEGAVDGISIDGSDSDGNITYLSRSDFKGTFTSVKAERRAMTQNLIDTNLYTRAMANEWIDSSDEAVTFGANNGHKVAEVVNGANKLTELGLKLGADFDAEEWDSVLDQITKKEMTDLVLHGYTKTAAINSIGKPQTRDVDGPAQIGSFNVDKFGTGFPNAIVIGQTWNARLAYDFGLAVGAEAASLGYDGWYAPGANIHRSPFGGRNYEYYSEDPILSGIMCGETVRAAKNAGVFCYIKHVALYEQETNRDSIYTWCTEQALREIYLKPFQIAVEHGATGFMTSYNRIGAIWAGGSEALMKGVMRDEWNFNGTILTDYADHHTFMNFDQAIRNGGDLFMDGWNNNGAFKWTDNSNSFNQALRSATKHILYMYLNAGYTNSTYNADTDVAPINKGTRVLVLAWWALILAAVDVAAVGGCGWWLYTLLRKKKTSEAQGAGNSTDSTPPANE